MKLGCPHTDIRGIYGDAINYTPHGARLWCYDCGKLLEGPVSLATDRQIMSKQELVRMLENELVFVNHCARDVKGLSRRKWKSWSAGYRYAIALIKGENK